MLENFFSSLIQSTTSIILIVSLVVLIIALILYLRVRLNPTNTIVVEQDFDSTKDRHSFAKKRNDYMKSKEWENRRKSVLERENNKCELCGKEAQAVHHKVYPADFKDDKLENLEALCHKCHYDIHKEQIANKKQESLFTDSVLSLSGKQHFKIEVKEAKNKAKYVVITELRADEKGRSDDIKILIFEENIELFNKSLKKAAKFIRYKRLLKAHTINKLDF